MDGVNDLLQIGGYLSNDKRTIDQNLILEKRIANLTAITDIYDRVTGAQDVYYDLFDETNDHSAGFIDTMKTKAIAPLTIGDTNLSTKVDTSNASVNWFKTGQEITIQDNVNKEYVTVTNGKIVEDTIVHDISTPTTVINSYYTTSTSARPQMLSNGWVVGAELNGTSIVMNVSRDGGITFTTLGVTTSFTGLNSFSLASKGTIVYLILNSSTAQLIIYSFDVSTWVDGTAINGGNTTYSNIDISQTAFSGCSLTINDAGTELHAAWSSKNATYPNSFNIRYAKGTINSDNSVTWNAVTQVSTVNTSGTDAINPCIVIQSNGKPAIVFTSPSSGVVYCTALTTSWPTNNEGRGWLVYVGGASYIQNKPDACATNDGAIHVVWYGTDSTDTTKTNIRYSKSTNNGLNWSTPLKLTSGNLYNQQDPSITFDKNNNLYVLWYGTSASYQTYFSVRGCKFLNGLWSQDADVIVGSSANAKTPSTCLNYQDFTEPIFIYSHQPNVKFSGVFSTIELTPQLEVSPLQNSYKKNALVYRSLSQPGEIEVGTTITEYNYSTPTTIADSAYATSIFARPIILSNGWIIASAWDISSANIIIYKSTDNGLNWELARLIGATNSTGHSIVAINETTIAIVYTLLNSSVYYRTYDVSTDTLSASIGLDNGTQTATDKCSLAINKSGTELHVCWSSKNATYPNAFNIRYAKGIIAVNGNVSWASATQITTLNTNGYNWTDPYIVINNNNNPVILAQGDTTIFQIGSFVWNGSTWLSYTIYNGTAGYTQLNPCAVVDNSGVIHVVWTGNDSVDTSCYNIRYSKSTDNGATWSTMLKLTSGNSYSQYAPTITYDSNNNLHVMWYGYSAVLPSRGNIAKISNIDGIWGNISWLTSNTTSNAASPSTCINYQDLIVTDPICIYTDGQEGTVKFRGVFSKISGTPTILNTLKFSNGYEDKTTYNAQNITVTANTYNTIGNGGRRLVRLDNGWLVSVVKTTNYFYFYISKDDGLTWSQLCFMNDGTIQNNDIVIASKGTIIYAINGFGGNVLLHVFDAISVPNQDIFIVSPYYIKEIDNLQTIIGNLSIAINESKTELHACWSSKNSNYTNSYNIRYIKGVINTDGSVTCGTAEQVSSDNQLNWGYLDPSIVLDSTNIPYILVDSTRGSTYSDIIYVFTKKFTTRDYSTGSPSNGWGNKIIFSNSYAQSAPSAIYVPQTINGLINGRIWVTWHGRDSVDTSVDNIRVSYSDNLGATWSTMQKLTSGNAREQVMPSIAVNKNNEVFVAFHGGDTTAAYELRMVKNVDDIWSSIITLINNTSTSHIGWPSTLADVNLDFNTPLLIYKDTLNSKVGFMGNWTEGSTIPLLEEDIRYNITPPLGDTAELVTWVDYEKDAGLTISNAFSLVDDVSNENYQISNESITNIDSNIDEKQTVLNSSIRGSKVAQRITRTRTSTDIDKSIIKILGAIGE